jgi:hypothetical protein
MCPAKISTFGMYVTLITGFTVEVTCWMQHSTILDGISLSLPRGITSLKELMLNMKEKLLLISVNQSFSN